MVPPRDHVSRRGDGRELAGVWVGDLRGVSWTSAGRCRRPCWTGIRPADRHDRRSGGDGSASPLTRPVPRSATLSTSPPSRTTTLWKQPSAPGGLRKRCFRPPRGAEPESPAPGGVSHSPSGHRNSVRRRSWPNAALPTRRGDSLADAAVGVGLAVLRDIVTSWRSTRAIAPGRPTW
jgi:hypothetical protein